jgi:photosystem II stability/assembly factor-like uncharacterized protein
VRFFTRKRLIVLGAVAAFFAAFAAIGALSRTTNTQATTTATVVSSTSGSAPSAMWYWTMSVSPSDENALVLATSGGLYLSGDGGKTWQPTGPKGLNATSLVQFGDALYAGGVHVGAVASPVVKTGATRSAGNGPAVLLVSADHGKTWKQIHPSGLPNVTVQALTTDPDAKSLYALLNNGKLYLSTDGAKSFKLVSAKIGAPPWALALTQGNKFLAGDMDTGAYQSANGQAWQRVPFKDSRGGKMVMEYAVRPGDSSQVLMSAFGLEMSTDRGKTWHVALKSDVMFGPVAWAPGSSDVAYGVGFDASVWRTDDGGKTWKKVT